MSLEFYEQIVRKEIAELWTVINELRGLTYALKEDKEANEKINLKRIEENTLIKRIIELEGLTRALKESHNNLCAPSLRKEPYKCPVCKGLGYLAVKLITKDDDLKKSLAFNPELTCHSCKGEGVVWG
jgi:uncharacterized protein (UPF0128 family)